MVKGKGQTLKAMQQAHLIEQNRGRASAGRVSKLIEDAKELLHYSQPEVNSRRPKSLKEIAAEAAEAEVKEAIKVGDMVAIAKYLRELSVLPSSPELLNQLGKYLDPDRPAMKSGPKTRTAKQKVLRSLGLEIKVMWLYRVLCRNQEYALCLDGKEAFEFAKSYWEAGPLDDDGLLLRPIVWEHPHSMELHRKRQLSHPLKVGDIQDIVCRLYDISIGELRKLLTDCRKKAAIDYLSLVERGLWPDAEVRQMVCQWHQMPTDELDKAIVRHGESP